MISEFFRQQDSQSLEYPGSTQLQGKEFQTLKKKINLWFQNLKNNKDLSSHTWRQDSESLIVLWFHLNFL